jgi:DNA-binding LacI/PurR family transcriptional regulator
MSTYLNKTISFDLGKRPQVAEVARDLKRLINTRNLSAGDQLPSQAELRDLRGYHNNTLDAAMDILVRCGVLSRKRRVGTIVVDPHRTVPNLWRVGVTVIPASSEQVYYAQLLQFMQTHLQAVGADISFFMLRPEAAPSKICLHSFDHLAEAHAEKRLDGLLTQIGIGDEDWFKLHEQGLELAHAGVWEQAPSGVVIDHVSMVEDAVMRLLSMGCKRLAIVSMKGPKPGFHRFWDSFRATSTAGGLEESAAVSLHGGAGPYGGWRVAEQILEMPADARPDGLIVIDDRIATGLAAALASRDGDYRPVIAIQTNLQAPLAYALPAIHYAVDVEQLAMRAVGNLMERLLSPTTPQKREYIYPELHSSKPQHLIINMKFSQKKSTPIPLAI